MKKSFQLEIPYETVKDIVEHFKPDHVVTLLVAAFLEALTSYLVYIKEEGEIEDETCLS